MNEEIMVSVCCPVYNHEKYLRQCLDGFMMQKTNFKFEVLIHDDASTDHSAEIIREYEKKYPNIIKPIYQNENQYSKGVRISWKYQYPRAKGKYIALCEGDDFWTDENKLQKQFDAMEKYPDASFCTHYVQEVDESGRNQSRVYPNNAQEKELLIPKNKDDITFIKPDRIIPLLIKGRYCFQTSSYFIRASIIKDVINDIPGFIMKAAVGDVPMMMLSAWKGDCIFINDYMSVYRRGVLTSWSTKRKNDSQFRLQTYQKWIDMLKAYDEYTEHHYTECVRHCILKSKLEVHAMKNEFKQCLSPEYKEIFDKYPLKTKISFHFFAMFPKLRPLYLKLRGEA